MISALQKYRSKCNEKMSKILDDIEKLEGAKGEQSGIADGITLSARQVATLASTKIG